MNRTTARRLEKLEQSQPARDGKWHQLIAWSEEDFAAQEAALKASGEWTEADNIIAHIIVTPDPARFA